MQRLAATAIAVLCASACAQADLAMPDGPHTRPDGRVDAGAGNPDAPIGTPDAPVGTPDAMASTPDATPMGGHLLLSEVVLAPTGGEMVEIVNPTAATVDLSTYYVTDTPTYFRLPAGTQTIDTSDFIARFPAGATIAPGAVITVAIDSAANFQTTYAVAPTYAVTGGTMIVLASGTQTLTNGGEPIVLFRWDGASDRVTDVDIVNAGTPSAGNALIDKSGIAIDGPDAGTTTTAYATDAMTIPTTTAPSSGKSIKRILAETGHETQNGTGNGPGGDDETSEQIGTTWDSTYTAPTPGTSPL